MKKATGTNSTSKAAALSPVASIWKGLALKKGNTIKIDQRQFMGNSQDLNKKIDRFVKQYIKKL
jgi:hypothetical protein